MNRILLGILATVTLGFGVQTYRVHSLKADVAALEVSLKAANERADTSEDRRTQEQEQANASYASADVRCSERVAQALGAGQMIERVTNVSGVEAGGVDRPIIDAGQLRVIIGQGAGRAAAGVSGGTDGRASQ